MSPKITKTRDDILRPTEMKVYLLMAKDPRIRGLLAFLTAYGKRIMEIMPLRRSDIHIDEEYISTRFKILKARRRSGIEKVVWKKVSLDNWIAPYILEFIEGMSPEQFLWPSYGKSGHVTDRMARYWLSEFGDVWPHLCRHSLAVQMAESGATIPELMAYFDWESESSAMHYVKTYGRAMTVMAEKWAKRPF